MSHHTSQFGFFIRCQNQSGIHVKKTARQGKRIDVIRVDHLDRERHLSIGVAYQVLSHPVDVFCNHRVLDQLYAGFHLLGILLAHGNLFLHPIPVSHASLAADIAVSHSINIRLTALVFYLVGVGLNAGRSGLGRGAGSSILAFRCSSDLVLGKIKGIA